MKQPRTERQPVYSSTCLYMFIHFGHFVGSGQFYSQSMLELTAVPSAQRWQASWWSGLNDEKEKARAVHSCTVDESTSLVASHFHHLISFDIHRYAQIR